MMIIRQAITQLYPSVKYVSNVYDAYDKSGNKVEIDIKAVDRQVEKIKEERLIDSIKKAASQKINQVLPDWKQRNMITRATYLMRKQQLTEAEEGELNDLESAWFWIEAVRSTSNLAEQTKTPVEDIKWPDIPKSLQ